MTPVVVFLGLFVFVLGWALKQLSKKRTANRDNCASPSWVHDNKKSTKNTQESEPSTWPLVISPLINLDLDADPQPFRPFKPIYHITMATQSTVPDDLIVMDRNYRKHIDYRRQVLADHSNVVLGVMRTADGDGKECSRTATPDAALSVRELYAYLMDYYLPARFPTVFTKKQQMLHNSVTGKAFPCTLAPEEDDAETLEQALRILGETVEDDFFLLQEEAGQATDPETGALIPGYPATSHRVVAFVCCFPSGFDPSTKLGKLLRDVHGPVPAYDKIGPSMEKFFARLPTGKCAKRVNWSIQTHETLFAPGNRSHLYGEFIADENVDIKKTNMRVECQTVSRFRPQGTIFFSFKTYLFPVTEIKAEGLGPRLADAIDGLKHGNAPGMWSYKGGTRWAKHVCEYLRS